jgi:hypothetical protein
MKHPDRVKPVDLFWQMLPFLCLNLRFHPYGQGDQMSRETGAASKLTRCLQVGATVTAVIVLLLAAGCTGRTGGTSGQDESVQAGESPTTEAGDNRTSPTGPDGGGTASSGPDGGGTASTGTTSSEPERKRKWYLPSFGPRGPSGEQGDPHYILLREGNCREVLEEVPESATERGRALLRAGAYACLGNVQEAEQTFDWAEGRPWSAILYDKIEERQFCALENALFDYLLRPPEVCSLRAATSTSTTATTSATISTTMTESHS